MWSWAALYILHLHVWLDGCSSYEWFVPVTWIKTGGAEQQYWLLKNSSKVYFKCIIRALQGNEHTTTMGFAFIQTGTNTEMVLGADDWLLANINMKGFFRVNYDSENWERLLKKLESGHEVQHVEMYYFYTVNDQTPQAQLPLSIPLSICRLFQWSIEHKLSMMLLTLQGETFFLRSTVVRY